MYAEVQVSSRIVLLQQISQSLGVAILAQTVAIYVLRDWTVPQTMMLFSCGFALVAIFIWRLAFNLLLKQIGISDKLLFLGRSATAEAVARTIQANPKAGYRVLGFLDDQSSGANVLGGFSSLRAVVAQHKPSLLVVGLDERLSVMPVADLVALRFDGLQIEEASQTFENVYQRVLLSELSPQQVMFRRTFTPGAGALEVAHFTSMVLGIAGLLVSLPAWCCLAVWLRLKSSEPVLLQLPREGKNGRVFQMYRFRRDPSLSWLFHRFHIDAMPELINVLRGDMRLVGPRPLPPEEARQLSETLPYFEYRRGIHAGMTGWAQIHLTGANQDNPALALEYDLYYIKHISLALNLYILAHSVKNRILRP